MSEDVGPSSGEKRKNIVCDICASDFGHISIENIKQHQGSKGCKKAGQARKKIHLSYKCDRRGIKLGDINSTNLERHRDSEECKRLAGQAAVQPLTLDAH